MQCTSCGKNLSVVSEFGIELDVCSSGCGGVWFDANELEKFDQEYEAVSSSVLFSGRNQNAVVSDRAKIKKCPKCPSANLDKKFHYSDFDIEIDSCSKCGGFWLDPGELKQLREQNQGREEREKIAHNFLQQVKNSDVSNKVKAVVQLLFK